MSIEMNGLGTPAEARIPWIKGGLAYAGMGIIFLAGASLLYGVFDILAQGGVVVENDN